MTKSLLAFPLALAALAVSGADDAAWEKLRAEALDRPRTVLYSTDGGDAVMFPRNLEATPENFIARRLAFVRGTSVDTIFYNVGASFNLYLFRTTAGEIELADVSPHPMLKTHRNIVGELIRAGTDPLQLAIEFSRAEKKEIFASIRFNDVHDQIHSPEKPFSEFPKFKSDHPEFLLGSYDARPKYCIWSAVDFSHPEVRNQFKAVVTELCAKYDIDGIEYDFMRHIQLLKSVADGGRASQQELDMMSGFMRELRGITEAAGRKRGRPILVAIRVPDSVGFCRGVGIDLEKWMKDRVFDIMSGASYFQLEPWRVSAELAHAHGIRFYASLDESRIERKGVACIAGRSLNNRNFMLGRAAAALASGCDGYYFFNLERGGLHNIAGTPPDALEFVDKDYYATERGSGGYRHRQFLRDSYEFDHMPHIDPGEPDRLTPEKPYRFELTVADDPASEQAQKRGFSAAALILADAKSGITLKLNGSEVPGELAADGLFEFPLPAARLKHGANTFEIAAAAPTVLRDFCVQVRYAPVEPEFFAKFRSCPIKLRGRVGVSDGKPVVSSLLRCRYRPELMPVRGGGLRLIHDSGAPGAEFMNFDAAKVLAEPAPVLLLEWRARAAVSAPGEKAFMVAFAVDRPQGDRWEESLLLGASELETTGGGKVRDNFGKMHTFRLALDTASGQYALWIDGVFRIPGRARIVNHRPAQFFVFGDGSGGVAGQAELEYFRIGTPPDPPELARYAASPIRETAAVRPADGKIELVGKWHNSYLPGTLRITGDGVIEMIHDSGEPGSEFMRLLCQESGLLAEPPELFAVEWQSRVAAAEPSLLVDAAPARPDGGVWETELIFAADRLLVNRKTEIAGDYTRFHSFRLIQNTRNGAFALWQDGAIIAAGTNDFGKQRQAPFLILGDGSGRVAGRAEVRCLAAGAVESDQR